MHAQYVIFHDNDNKEQMSCMCLDIKGSVWFLVLLNYPRVIFGFRIAYELASEF